MEEEDGMMQIWLRLILTRVGYFIILTTISWIAIASEAQEL